MIAKVEHKRKSAKQNAQSLEATQRCKCWISLPSPRMHYFCILFGVHVFFAFFTSITRAKGVVPFQFMKRYWIDDMWEFYPTSMKSLALKKRSVILTQLRQTTLALASLMWALRVPFDVSFPFPTLPHQAAQLCCSATFDRHWNEDAPLANQPRHLRQYFRNRFSALSWYENCRGLSAPSANLKTMFPQVFWAIFVPMPHHEPTTWSIDCKIHRAANPFRIRTPSDTAIAAPKTCFYVKCDWCLSF